MVLDGKSSQEYPVNAEVPQRPILGPTLFLLCINDLCEDVICGIAIFADYTSLCSKCDQASDLWNNLNWLLNLNLVYKTLDWDKKWLVDFSAGKTHLVLYDQSNNSGFIDLEMDGSVLEEKSSFEMLGLTFSSKLDLGSYSVSITKTASNKIGGLIRSMKFLHVRLLCI